MENMVSFTYREKNELISAQDVLLRLADHLYKYCDIVNYNIRPYYFACLSQLLKRGELDLGSFSFNVKEK